MFDCAHDVGRSGAARSRRQRRLRMHWRHEQLSLRMLRASMGHYSWQSRMSVGIQTVDEKPAATCAATALAPTTDIANFPEPPIAIVTPTLAMTHTPTDVHVSPARVPTVQEQVIVQKNSELQVMERIQKQKVESIKEDPQERVQQRTVEQIVRVPVPTVQKQMCVPVNSGFQVMERIPEHIVESSDQEELDQLRHDWLMGAFRASK